MPNINLLPADVRPKESVVKTSRIVKKLIIVVFSLFILSISVFGATYYRNLRKLKTTAGRISDLKTSISALEQTEQKLVLVKDRLSKISDVLSMPSVVGEIEILKDINDLSNSKIVIDTASLSVDNVMFTINVSDSETLVNLFSDLSNKKNYDSVEITSINYNAETGFNIGMRISSLL